MDAFVKKKKNHENYHNTIKQKKNEQKERFNEESILHVSG
jgi:hypothetical protein